MKRLLSSRGRGRSIKARVLTIVAIPSAVLLIVGLAATAYLVEQGTTAKNWASRVQAATLPNIQFISRVEAERRLTMLRLAGERQDTADLAMQRQLLDTAVADLVASGSELEALNPGVVQQVGTEWAASLGELSGFRQKVDASQVSPRDAYAYYNRLAGLVGLGLQTVSEVAPDAATAVQEATSVGLYNAADTMSRANALGVSAIASGGLAVDDLREYRTQVGAYHTQLQQLLPRLAEQEQARYQNLVAGSAWQRLTTMENTLIDRGAKASTQPDTRPLPMPVAEWQEAARQVTAELTAIWTSHHHAAEDSAVAYGDRTFRNSLLAGAGVLIATVIALLIAVRLSNRLIRRLKRLRADTLRLADERLPQIVARLRDGETIDPATEIPLLDHGHDEIGEVAEAFNKAQQTAVAAATQEARTREGMNAVFLDIAHRSQIIVRRQLEVLDEAEGKQDDPTHLELLFRLDHLATRARRNAENLVILGGGRPGRKWRNPVGLEEIARSAVSETTDFTRVGAVRLPDIAVKGTVVADLIHLIAELVDNATSFSPPGSRVEVRGNLVGKGAVIVIEDQGLGMRPGQLDQLNAMLHDPPDFQVMALSGQTRLGLFVVAQLAAQHDITVTLTDSDYGGIRAIVLVPVTAIATELARGDADQPESHVSKAEVPSPRPRLAVPHARQDVSWFEDTAPVEDTLTGGGQSDDTSPTQTQVARPVPAGPVTNANQHTHTRAASDKRAPLPRRRRQANLAPQLTAGSAPADASVAKHTAVSRPPERARDTMAAVLRGTRQARQAMPPHGRVDDNSDR